MKNYSGGSFSAEGLKADPKDSQFEPIPVIIVDCESRYAGGNNNFYYVYIHIIINDDLYN
jgi:hypothetical protein